MAELSSGLLNVKTRYKITILSSWTVDYSNNVKTPAVISYANTRRAFMMYLRSSNTITIEMFNSFLVELERMTTINVAVLFET